MARREGSASATNTCSAIASMSGGIEVVNQFAEFLRPPLCVAAEGVAVGVLRQLRKAALDDGEPRGRTDRFERELDVGAAWIVLGQAIDVPGETEHPLLLDPLAAHVALVATGPRHAAVATRAHVARR